MKLPAISAAAAAILLLAVAGPVGAWSAIGVTITGDPGGTIVGTGEEAVPELLVSPVLPGRPAGDLGPKLQISYSFGGSVVAVEDLYPYAPDGPVAYSAASGEIVDHPYSAGWRQARPSLLDTLVAWGLSPKKGASAEAGAASGGQTVAALDAHDRVRPHPPTQASGIARIDNLILAALVVIAGLGAALAFSRLAAEAAAKVRRPA